MTFTATQNIGEDVFWNVYDKSTSQYISDEWTNLSALTTVTINIKDKALLKRLLPNQEHVSIVFATKEKNSIHVPTKILSVGEYCKSHPTYFKDLTNTDRTCSEISDADLPNSEAQCADLSKKLKQYVEDGLINLEHAQRMFKKDGCGDWEF